MIVRGNGFMGFWSNIDPTYQLTYQKWHNCEHMPERVSIPGFIEGRRYRSSDDTSEFFMCYVTQAPEVLRSESYLAALNRPTPWTQEALTRFLNPRRTLFRCVATAGTGGAYRPYLGLMRFDQPDEAETLAERLLAPLARYADCAGAMFEMDVDASEIMTAERKIYSGGPSRQRYLLALEAMAPETVPALLKDPSTLLGKGAQHIVSGTYWLEARVFAGELSSNARAAEDAQGARP